MDTYTKGNSGPSAPVPGRDPKITDDGFDLQTPLSRDRTGAAGDTPRAPARIGTGTRPDPRRHVYRPYATSYFLL